MSCLPCAGTFVADVFYPMQKEDMRWQINALGLVESLDGEQAITLRFFLDDSNPDMRASEKQRWSINLDKPALWTLAWVSSPDGKTTLGVLTFGRWTRLSPKRDLRSFWPWKHCVVAIIGPVHFVLPLRSLEKWSEYNNNLTFSLNGRYGKLRRKPRWAPGKCDRVQACLNGLKHANTGFFITQLCSLSTITREWTALHHINDVNFKDLLLDPASAEDTASLTKLKAPVVSWPA